MWVCGGTPSGSPRGHSLLWGLWGEAPPPEADEFFVFKTVIFNASAVVLHKMMYCLSCFFRAQVYGFTVRICPLVIKLEQNDSWVERFAFTPLFT